MVLLIWKDDEIFLMTCFCNTFKITFKLRKKVDLKEWIKFLRNCIAYCIIKPILRNGKIKLQGTHHVWFIVDSYCCIKINTSPSRLRGDSNCDIIDNVISDLSFKYYFDSKLYPHSRLQYNYIFIVCKGIWLSSCSKTLRKVPFLSALSTSKK